MKTYRITIFDAAVVYSHGDNELDAIKNAHNVLERLYRIGFVTVTEEDDE